MRVIAENAGKEGGVIIGQVLERFGAQGDFAMGYDAAEDVFVDMFKAGIIDPLKVVRTGLKDAR